MRKGLFAQLNDDTMPYRWMLLSFTPFLYFPFSKISTINQFFLFHGARRPGQKQKYKILRANQQTIEYHVAYGYPSGTYPHGWNPRVVLHRK
jgi:hypothetical protein